MIWQCLAELPAVTGLCNALVARKNKVLATSSQTADRSSAVKREPAIASDKDYGSFENTIAVIPKPGLKNTFGLGITPDTEADKVLMIENSFRIRLANMDHVRNSASVLINKMYSWRGYAGLHQIKNSPSSITLIASDKNEVIGTVTLDIDSPVGLLSDEIFKNEINFHRQKGGKVCEITKLAFDTDRDSKGVLASLFHILFIYGRRIHECTDVFIEVNPRHRIFYERMLGFKPQGEIKTNPRVNAPACLLWANLDYVESQIRKYGGTSSNPETTRSLYTNFFSQDEEEGIAGRLIHL